MIGFAGFARTAYNRARMRRALYIFTAVWSTLCGAAVPAQTDNPAGPPTTTSAPAATASEADRARIDVFVARVTRDPSVNESARRVIADAWKRRRAEADPRPFLEEALAVLSSDFRKALDAMNEQDYAKADRLLTPLTASPDPCVAVHAAALLARAMLEQDKDEQALKLLEAWRDREEDIARHSFQGPEMEFMRAYALLRNLRYEQAAIAFTAFLRDHPDAPDRLRLTARQILQELQARRPKHLGDIADLMAYAGRQLRAGYSDRPVAEAQGKAIDLLSSLIKEAEEQEDQQQNGNAGGNQSGTPGGMQPPNAPADRSTAPEGRAEMGPTHRAPAARPGETWGQLPAQRREKILQSLRKNFPQRYRELVEQYYRQLGKQD